MSADYIGITKFPAFAWAFIKSLPDGTLLCAGGELMKALGLESTKGNLYEIDTGTLKCLHIH